MLHLDDTIRAPRHLPRLARRLRWRIDELADGLSASGIPVNQADVDRIHAFRVLAHAEVQSYLEDVADRILTVSSEMLSHRSVVTHAAHHLMVFRSILPLASASTAAQASYPAFARSTVRGLSPSDFDAAAKAHRKLLERNSGLKASNIRMILGPLGYRDSWFPPGFLDQMDTFGVDRGHVAHRSGLVGTTQWPSGSSERTRIALLRDGLEAVDAYSARLLMPI